MYSKQLINFWNICLSYIATGYKKYKIYCYKIYYTCLYLQEPKNGGGTLIVACSIGQDNYKIQCTLMVLYES